MSLTLAGGSRCPCRSDLDKVTRRSTQHQIARSEHCGRLTSRNPVPLGQFFDDRIAFLGLFQRFEIVVDRHQPGIVTLSFLNRVPAVLGELPQ
ncbi:hypothetical protein RER_05170 [Rhodococcus erythropolis PR4]|uniref:Uncharacterized protein n=1 Tax=Rhodococcus erythropolis (strain PR4 / NBRC 100887) TaxID=234621 RepID=C0ZNH3_RHOE4|nr:hypothetical protein RER_05170 [Rhodococcus erythropolis PR4]